MQKLIRACVNILPKPLRELYYKYEEKWLYLFFGVLTTVVSFVSAGIAKHLLEAAGLGKSAVGDISTVISWVCAVTFAYLTNRVWVFESHAKGFKALAGEAASFYGGRVFTLVVEFLIMKIGYSWIGINYWVTKIAANVIVLILNYVISKIFVFRDKKDPAQPESK
ncbi:MAG: GtrA family protein [Ruminococcus sp.]|nr:GtrA family protein [Ruminococcus sp.]